MAIVTLDSSNPLVEESQLDGAVLFALHGEFDAFSAPALEARLCDAIEERRRYELVIDMTDVTFVDMSTMNTIVRAMKLVYRHNGHLVVVCTSRAVLRVVDLAGMRHSLRVFPTREDAIAGLRAPRSPA